MYGTYQAYSVKGPKVIKMKIEQVREKERGCENQDPPTRRLINTVDKRPAAVNPMVKRG